ncbi:MAG TPA: PKD domain-containing protein, partial [Acidimicrobiales bacterium]|nr:PKD domain-containing protein [Acidimicrobiales bacterium]
AKVANPGSAQLRFDSGTLQIRDEVFDAGSADEQVVANVTVQANGGFTVNSLSFPPIPPIDGPLGDVNISIEFHEGSGNVNPLNGAMTLGFRITIHADGGGVGSNCRIPNIQINSSTAASGGVPYNHANGRVTLADHTFSVPEATGCSTFPVNVNDEINDELGLPSPSGQNHAVFSGFFTPILNRALVASFSATPQAGPAPLEVAFDASSTFHTRPITSYQWDFDGNGTFDQSTASPTTSTTYTTAGTRTVRLRVTDADGDIAETTRQVVVGPPAPDVVIEKTGDPNVIVGDTTDFTIQVDNVGGAATSGTTTVTDTLPGGLSFDSASGTGWSCGATGPVVTCTSTEVVPAFTGSFPDLTITAVADGTTADVTVTNTAAVTTDGELFLGSSDTADILLIPEGIDLQVTKVHDEDDGLFVGQRATYVISVENIGTEPAEQLVQLTDDLPDGVDVVSVSGGLDWVCSHALDVVSCFTDQDVAPGGSLDDVRIRVELTTDVVSPLSNTASVTVDGESNAANNSDTDTGEVLGYEVDYEIFKAQLGDLVVGEPGTYGIGVQNIGTATGGGTVTVVDELPAGITYVGFSADDWSCGAVDQTVTCTHPGGVEGGDLLPGITLQVAVDEAALPGVTNTATVSGAGDVNEANDSASHTSTVRRPVADLTISKSHVGNFETGSNGSYTITVRNLAVERADGPTTVVDSLPAGVGFVSATGTGWVCDASALPQVTCTYADPIAGLDSAPPITLVVSVPDGAPEIVTNQVAVSNAADSDTSDNGAADPTRIDRRAQAPTTLEADAIVLRLNVIPLPRISISVLNAPYAVLTSDGEPVPGKLVTFRTLNGSAVLCSAVTDADGVATCPGDLATYLATLTSLRYHADFDGDFDHAAAHDEAAIIHLNGLKLL